MTNRQAWGVLTFAVLIGALGLLVIAAGVCGCGAAPTLAQQNTEAIWTDLDAFCLAHSTNASGYNACLDANRETFCRADGGLAYDSGSCVNVTLSNGSRP